MNNFWKPVKIKQKNFGFIPRIKPVKHISKKNLTYPEAIIRYPKLKPFGDADKDGVKNWLDCKPFDRKKQHDPRHVRDKMGNIMRKEDFKLKKIQKKLKKIDNLIYKSKKYPKGLEQKHISLLKKKGSAEADVIMRQIRKKIGMEKQVEELSKEKGVPDWVRWDKTWVRYKKQKPIYRTLGGSAVRDLLATKKLRPQRREMSLSKKPFGQTLGSSPVITVKVKPRGLKQLYEKVYPPKEEDVLNYRFEEEVGSAQDIPIENITAVTMSRYERKKHPSAETEIKRFAKENNIKYIETDGLKGLEEVKEEDDTAPEVLAQEYYEPTAEELINEEYKDE